MNGNQPPSDQRRLLIAVALSAAIIALWSVVFPPAKPKPTPTPPAAASTASGAPSTASAAAPAPGAVPSGAAGASAAGGVVDLSALPESTVTLEDAGLHGVTISSRDGQIRQWDLFEEQYRKAAGEAATSLPFVRAPAADFGKGVFLPPTLELSLGGQRVVGAYAVTREGETAVATFTDAAHQVQVERVYRTGSTPYAVDVTLRLKNLGSAPVPFGVAARLAGAQNDKEAAGHFMSPPVFLFEALCAGADKLERHNIQSVAGLREKPEEQPRYTDGLVFGGVDNRYFLTGVLPGPEGLTSCELFVGAEAAGVAPKDVAPGTSYLATRLEMPEGTLAPGQTVERSLRFYGGPKKLDALSAQTPSLSQAVDFGMFSPICVLMLSTLRWFFGLIPNWAVAIVLLTIFVKLLTLPLTHKQYKSMAAMKAIQPQLKAIQEKYKEDRMRLQQEMMKLYKDNGVNPLAGCLPVVAMMPVYIALYRTIYSAVELYQAELGLWIHDLSEADPYLILPIVLGGLFILQTRLNPPTGDAMQQKLMTWFMPIMFTGMMLFLPSGLVVYILCNTLLGIAQQAYMNKHATLTPAPAGARGRS